ncbi:YqgE/AlgH family protein [Commensalibacter sp. Nvir]|uniref:YqgE/AlgH family protein n=1 Tax=Commensalibacter sp. Nvir TaxID=3069817 RepID=UPI0030C7B9FE
MIHYSDLSNGFAGQFLVASPYISTPPFAQSVIFVCAHSSDDGAMGIIVNRRLTNPTPDELLKQLGITTIPQSEQFSISAGGPVENAHGLVLHTPDWETNGCISVTNSIKLNASLDVLRDISQGKGPKHALLALGHANWSAGQLEQEILDNIWQLAPYHDDILFGCNYNKKWQIALNSISVTPEKLSNLTGRS